MFLLVKMVQIYTLLIILCVSGAVADCPRKVSFFISAPERITALTGSCLQIPCSFQNAHNATGDIYGVWIKNDSRFGRDLTNVIFNSSKAVNTYPMDLVGNLSEKNCTTRFSKLTTHYTDTYFFRVETNSFKGTASCNGLQITVKDSPPRPTLEVSGNLAELKEKQSVTITCSAPTPCPLYPPRLTWSLQQDAHSQTEENTERTFTTKIQQNVTLSDRHDGFNLSCSAVYPVDGGEHEKTAVAELTLNVSYAPKDTSASISPPGWVSAGSWVNLTCSSRARPAVSYTWFKTSDHGGFKVSEGDFYSFNVTEEGVYYCVAANVLGNQTSKLIPVMVEGMEQAFSSAAVVGGILGIITFICVVFFLWWLKSSRSTFHQAQSSVLPESVGTTNKEEIHYGEIDFSKLRQEPSSSSQQPHLVYSLVKTCRDRNRSEQTGESPDTLYAQVVRYGRVSS